MRYRFQWNPRKAKSNARKHGVSFSQAAEIFLDPLQLNVFDDEHGEIEERWITLGKARDGALLVVVHTFAEHEDSATIRIISARKATKHEQRQYEAS
jgi:hypothetical protein